MGKIKVIIFFIVFGYVFLTFSSNVLSQNNQEVKTTVGNPDSPEPANPDGGGSNDDLSAGKFKVPFRCNLNYWSWTYSGHSPYSIDINRGSGSTDRGDDVLASADGKVYDIINSNGQVAISHEGNYYTLYAHMQNIRVREGDQVRQGEKIGEIGDSGSPGQYHLHINHSKGSPYVYANRIQVCYVGYGCNPASVSINTRTRYGTDYNRGCN